MAWEPVNAPAECMVRIISLPSFASFSTALWMKATSEERSLAFGPSVPVLVRGITEVGHLCWDVRMSMTLEKAVGPSQSPGTKTTARLDIETDGWITGRERIRIE